MKLWDYEQTGGNLNYESGCCSMDSINDARMVCAAIGIPHYVMNFSREFHQEVVDDFVNEYMAGRTPNPCVLCNMKIKWGTLIDKAKELGADYMATGHYARVKYNQASGKYELFKGADKAKDQSYALWGISQGNLAKTIFPLGELTKKEIRDIAQKHGMRTAAKKESMEICFVPDKDYNRFLKHTVTGLEEKVASGSLLNIEGKKIGEHKGYPFYTIGQRRGIGTGFGKPMYVVDIRPEKNEVVLGEDSDLLSSELTAKNVNIFSGIPPEDGTAVQAKIRYKSPAEPAMLFKHKDAGLTVRFMQPQRAITPGQSVVFYDDDKVLGGGIIETSIKDN